MLTIDKQLPTSPHKVQGLNRRPQRWEYIPYDQYDLSNRYKSTVFCVPLDNGGYIKQALRASHLLP